ncbi:MAG: glucose-inhibited division protein A [Parcubacteria group bacterium GW2011_GWA2_36_10]|nr:MAG: glucose-inhibited division protein A [Parcubacteria group bacterium GW2011_GWA2_36_10]
MQKFYEQAMLTGAEFDFTEVETLSKTGDLFTLKTAKNQSFQAKAIILAFGLTPRNLNVPGEKEFGGKGVAYCATCDGPLYKAKTVAVIGGGNSALDAAEFLSKIAAKVYLLNRKDVFRGEEILLKKVQASANIELIYNAESKEVIGDTKVNKLVYTQANTDKEIAVEGIFVEIGHLAKTDWVANLVELNERKEIKISLDCETKTPGLFAAGDITDISYKQAVISAGEGSKAALQAYKFLQGSENIVLPDWSPKK